MGMNRPYSQTPQCPKARLRTGSKGVRTVPTTLSRLSRILGRVLTTATPAPPIGIRSASPADAAACAAIYRPYVLDSVASFEESVPDAAAVASRMASAWCWLVAETPESVVGYAYGSPHRERAAYRWAADVAVYVDPSVHRRGIGRALYSELFERLRDCGIWTLCAGIAEPNPASTALHLSVGFEPVGTYRRIGWKAGAWHDVAWYQLHLRAGAGPPHEPNRA
jgi:L-amino acid N-acyltransferase YncA